MTSKNTNWKNCYFYAINLFYYYGWSCATFESHVISMIVSRTRRKRHILLSSANNQRTISCQLEASFKNKKSFEFLSHGKTNTTSYDTNQTLQVIYFQSVEETVTWFWEIVTGYLSPLVLQVCILHKRLTQCSFSLHASKHWKSLPWIIYMEAPISNIPDRLPSKNESALCKGAQGGWSSPTVRL